MTQPALHTAAASSDQKDHALRPLANAIRALAMDAVEAAQSGHPGMPMGMADVAAVLYSKFLKFNPEQPEWPDRDRFVLSAGHGSMLLYAVNYLTGYKALTLEQLKNFRQLGALTAGHPEIEHHAGIETTTGPLGQGIATAVGMALAERILNARFGDELVDHYTYVIASDGDLMEGISHESCSLAGHLGLSRLIVLYDDNSISIDGPTDLSFTENTPLRFQAYGWETLSVDGHNYDDIAQAIQKAKASSKPTLISCRTQIGFGAPTKQGSESSHGAPLGAEEIKGAREKLNWPHAPFEIPADILDSWRSFGKTGAATSASWSNRLAGSPHKPAFEQAMKGDVSAAIAPVIEKLKKDIGFEKPRDATRKSSGRVIEMLVQALPQLIGGSADLSGSNNTKAKAPAVIKKDSYDGQYIHYGVREHAMAAAMNGMALHGGVIPYGGTFLVFTDYCRPSIRLSALMKQRVIYIMTHDSIGLGEDGPTHQPVEHLAALRAIPGLRVYRPCDGIETAEAWQAALNNPAGPSVLVLSRQNLPTLRKGGDKNLTQDGGYILRDCESEPQVALYASGSEVSIAAQACDILQQDGIAARLISVPGLDALLHKDDSYRTDLSGGARVKVAVEAGIRQGWDQIIGADGVFIGMNSFGASGPAEDLYKHFGITAGDIVNEVKTRLA